MTGISPGEPVGDAVRRLAHHRLEPAVEALGRASEADLDDVVHDVRKRCKRTRALLRLVRDDLPDVYREENRALRDAARELSPVRDAAVLVRAHEEVARASGMPMDGLRNVLVRRHHVLRQRVCEDDTLARVRDTVAVVVGRIDTWPISAVGWDVLGAGFERVYRRGRKAMEAAYEEPGTERFHQWRSRAKYLRLQLALLEELWPEVMGGVAKSAHALTDVLGDEHDLAVLAAAAAGARVDPDAEADAFADLIACRRRLLQARARPIGARLYAEKPSRFVSRLGRYWEAGTRAPAA